MHLDDRTLRHPDERGTATSRDFPQHSAFDARLFACGPIVLGGFDCKHGLLLAYMKEG